MSTLTLITGASSGIGYDLAHECAKHGHDLILVARSENKLNELATLLKKSHQINTHVITIDLAKRGSAQKLYLRCNELNLKPNILINNAGIGDCAQLINENPLKIEELITLNIETLTLLCRFFAVHMVESKSGRILNVASTAAFQPGPNMAAYFASKAYVLHFSEALYEELRPHGVSVTTLCPGPTETQFKTRAEFKNTNWQSPWTMKSSTVAKAAYYALMRGDDIYIAGFINRIMAFLTRFSPRSWSRKIAGRAALEL